MNIHFIGVRLFIRTKIFFPAGGADATDKHFALARREIGKGILREFAILPIPVVGLVDLYFISTTAERALGYNANLFVIDTHHFEYLLFSISTFIIAHYWSVVNYFFEIVGVFLLPLEAQNPTEKAKVSQFLLLLVIFSKQSLSLGKTTLINATNKHYLIFAGMILGFPP
jgi:hypothetical protein